jgi:putative addiction module component (TIGR02574 family)
MTRAAIQKLAIRLPVPERLKLADALLESVPPMRDPVTLAELERRADEVESGKATLISSEKFDAELARLEAPLHPRRPAQRG